jgi:15-cis-phytoene synthase/lycopene beta-cyclase
MARSPTRVSHSTISRLMLISRECLFFILTTHLITISTNLISHLHTLLVLSPDLPPCPPSNLVAHIGLLAQVAFYPSSIPEDTLIGLTHAEETLREGSKSFDVAKLAFGREMRIALVAVYAWCRMTVCHLILLSLVY